jgi:hypothetical protein
LLPFANYINKQIYEYFLVLIAERCIMMTIKIQECLPAPFEVFLDVIALLLSIVVS